MMICMSGAVAEMHRDGLLNLVSFYGDSAGFPNDPSHGHVFRKY